MTLKEDYLDMRVYSKWFTPHNNYSQEQINSLERVTHRQENKSYHHSVSWINRSHHRLLLLCVSICHCWLLPLPPPLPLCCTDSQVTVLKPAVCYMQHCLGWEGRVGVTWTSNGTVHRTGRHHKPRSWTSAHESTICLFRTDWYQAEECNIE